MVLSALSGQALAQDGLYMGMDLGVAIAPGMSVSGTDNDWSTKCDKIINPTQAETGDGCFFPPPPSAWVDQVGEGSGVLTGLARGYRRGNLRVEGEYFLRTTTYDDRSRTRIGVIVFYPLSSSLQEPAWSGHLLNTRAISYRVWGSWVNRQDFPASLLRDGDVARHPHPKGVKGSHVAPTGRDMPICNPGG